MSNLGQILRASIVDRCSLEDTSAFRDQVALFRRARLCFHRTSTVRCGILFRTSRVPPTFPSPHLTGIESQGATMNICHRMLRLTATLLTVCLLATPAWAQIPDFDSFYVFG